ncbi:MAG: thrombospondin type 3 repeat-containing protein [Bacteroidota bacterium]
MTKLISKNTLFLFVLLCFCLPYQILAQGYTYKVSANGSDYQVKAEFDADKFCQCDDSYGMVVWRNNFSPSNLMGSTKGSGSKRSVTFAVGPSTSNNYILDITVEGKNKFLFVDCSVSCKGEGSSTARSVKTAAIKRPTNGSASDDQDDITISWKKGTNIPNNRTKYYIYKDGGEDIYATVNGSTFTYTDENVGPGETHTYLVKTRTDDWGGHTSTLGLTIVGKTRPRLVTGTFDVPQKVTLTWDDLSDITEEVTIRRNGEQISTLAIRSVSDTIFSDSDPTLVPGFKYDYSITWFTNDLEYLISTQGSTQANGRIRGKVATPGSGVPIEGVAVCVEQEANIEQSEAGVIYCDTTDANGQYDVRRIYYNQEATFTVTPSKEDHFFNPGFFDKQLLDLSVPIIDLDFQDTTSFVVSGYVRQSLNSQSCGIAGIAMLLDGVNMGIQTDEDGYYEILVEESGTYTIAPDFPSHEFTPQQQRLVVAEHIENLNFEDVSQQTISGKVLASCDIFIGKADVRIYSEGGEGCIDTTVTTDDLGFYEVPMPARPYQVEVVAFEVSDGINLAPDAVVSYFQTEAADLTVEGQIQDFVYRNPPSIVVSGFPENECQDLAYAVVDQQEVYYLDIEVREAFGESSCPVETGYVLIYDEVGDKANEPDSLIIKNGFVQYEVNPGDPNLIAPHQKTFQIEAYVDEEVTQWTEKIIVTGVRAREQTFTTVSPEIPFMILHDPPGDASYSSLAENVTSELAVRLYGTVEGSVTAQKQVKLGYKVSQTIIPGTSILSESWGTLGTSFGIGASITAGTEWIMSMTSTEEFKTSASEDIIGEEGDIYLGAAINLIYAQADILEYDAQTCSIEQDIDIIMGNDGFSTTFLYTEDHIQGTLIPQLAGLKNFYEQNQSDSAKIYENQINVWQQILDQNRENKSAAEFIENRSFSAGANYRSAVTSSVTGKISLDMSLFMEQSIVLGAGYEVAGNGVSGMVETKHRIELGTSINASLSKERTIGFELRDDDPGDFFSVDVKKDPVYGTPVFNLISGRSSCPWEKGTQPRETLQLQADTYNQNNIEENGEAVFELGLGNISQSDETQTYLLQFLQATNPDGARVRIGGSEAQSPIPYTIGAGQQRKATVTIEKGPRATNYNDLAFVLASGCGDAAIADTVQLSVNFQSAYPGLVIEEPKDNWLANQGNNGELLVWFRNYDLDRLKKIQLQISPRDRHQWQTMQEWQPGIISNSTSGMAVQWDIEAVPDGDYDLRFRADYGDQDLYTATVSGTMDRQAPRLFGLPEPTDGELSGGDIIALQVDEMINCFQLNREQITLLETKNQQNIPFEYGCTGQEIIISPLWNRTDFEGDTIEVSIHSIADLSGNVSAELMQWSFVVSAASGPIILDTDQDGISDDQDNCPLAANPDQQDLDGDGIGDSCDDDIDGDGISNEVDNCVNFPNPDQFDNNGNGIGNPCEPEADGDGDGIPNAEDNCPLTANADQSDIDQDGIGDICDEDMDGDGVPNASDNCPSTPNPDQASTNATGMGDACNMVVSTEELAIAKEAIKIVPNPATSAAQLQFELLQTTELQLRVLDVRGALIYQQDLGLRSVGEYTEAIQVNALMPGIYFIELQSNRQVWTERLVVH